MDLEDRIPSFGNQSSCPFRKEVRSCTGVPATKVGCGRKAMPAKSRVTLGGIRFIQDASLPRIIDEHVGMMHNLGVAGVNLNRLDQSILIHSHRDHKMLINVDPFGGECKSSWHSHNQVWLPQLPTGRKLGQRSQILSLAFGAIRFNPPRDQLHLRSAEPTFPRKMTIVGCRFPRGHDLFGDHGHNLGRSFRNVFIVC